MPQKLLVLCLIVICVTLIAVIWITRDSLCQLRVRQGTTEIAAILSCLKQR
ncbi:Hok/Gef family protein [Serratia sp. T13T92]|uniref:Hok/Gef family protein n=1 Tax=Serratia sp. T13T92 TaxID=3397496 RepID=UPI0039DFCF5A